HIPASRRTPYPGGADLPQEYWHTYDPFVALTAAASVTTKLKVATGICLIIERDPITTAKEVASLDMLSNGRFIFGIGAGWNAEAAGRDPQTISITIFGAKPERETLDQLEAAGVERAIFMLPAADRDTVMPLVDRFTGLIR